MSMAPCTKPKTAPNKLLIKRLPGKKAANLKSFSIKMKIKATICALIKNKIIKEVILKTPSFPEIKPLNQLKKST